MKIQAEPMLQVGLLTVVKAKPFRAPSRCVRSIGDPDCLSPAADAAHAGREVRESMFHQVADLFHDLDMGMLPISVLFPYLPIPAHWARDR